MVSHLSCEIRDLPAPSSNNNQGYVSLKHPRTEEDGCEEDMELSRKKKVKQNNSETEADSSLSDDSCFVSLVTASNLHQDALYLPKDFSSSNGLQRECRKIVITDGGKRSWVLDLRFNKSSDTFYVSRGWPSFCDENLKKAGSLFVFKLVGKGETPLLSFCPAESRAVKASKKESLPVEPSSGKKLSKEETKKNSLRSRDSTPPSQNRFVTLTCTQFSSLNKNLCWFYLKLRVPFVILRLNIVQQVPLAFLRENGLDKPGMITLLGKDGTKWLANLRWEGPKQMSLGKGWKKFAIANGLKTGESFTLELIWENRTPMLSLFNTNSTSSTRQQGEYCLKASGKEHASTEPNSGNKAKNSREEMRESSSTIENRSVTLTLTLEDVRDCILILPSEFMKVNGINKLGKITLLGKNKKKWLAYLLTKDGLVALGCDWNVFCEDNGVKIGEPFTLEFLHEQDATLVFEFSPNSRD